MRRKALGKNTSARLTELISGATRDIPVPMGVVLRNEEEHLLWRQFTRARAPDGWREYDLLFLVKQVQLEADIRQLQKQLDLEGVIVQTEHGPTVNPLFAAVEKLSRRQLAYARAHGLLQSKAAGSPDPRTLNAAGLAAKRLRDALDEDDDLDGLLAGVGKMQ